MSRLIQVELTRFSWMPHVFQAYYAILDQAAATLDRAGQFLSAHLAGDWGETRTLTPGA
jgi:hypothetical protein